MFVVDVFVRRFGVGEQTQSGTRWIIAPYMAIAATKILTLKQCRISFYALPCKNNKQVAIYTLVEFENPTF
jgi:hypothetical protein